MPGRAMPVRRFKLSQRPAFLLLPLALSACAGSAREGGASHPNRHPNPAYIDETMTPAFAAALDATTVGSGLEVGRVLARSGSSPAGSDDVVGRIADGLLLPGGQVLLVDDALEKLHVYQATGEKGSTIGRPGRGPGEFEQPRAAALAAGTTLLVAEGVRMQMFRRTGRSFEHQGALNLDVPAQDLCLIGDTLVTTG